MNKTMKMKNMLKPTTGILVWSSTKTERRHRADASGSLLLAALVVFGALHTGAAHAVDRHVDATNGVDAGNCTDPLSPCRSIRFAVQGAMPGDVINLMSLTGTTNVYAESGIATQMDLTIRGAGPAASIIDARSLDRAFMVFAGHLRLEQLSIRKGNPDPTFGGEGGAVLVLQGGSLTVRRSVLHDNRAVAGGAVAGTFGSGTIGIHDSRLLRNRASAVGGGVYCDGCGRVLMSRSTVRDNLAGTRGGALFLESSALRLASSRLMGNAANHGGAIGAVDARLSVQDSELSENEAEQGDGGAISSSGDLNIERSALIGNVASDNGGALRLSGPVTLTASNSTFSGNTALAGGGLSFFGAVPASEPNARISNSTFADNTALAAGTAHHLSGSWNSLSLDTSILHLSAASQASGSACFAPADAGVRNLVSDDSCDSGAPAFNLGAVTGLDPVAAFNRGRTRVHAIAAWSNAVDAGSITACSNPLTGTLLTLDQRRRPRPRDGDQNGLAVCDVGAFERQ